MEQHTKFPQAINLSWVDVEELSWKIYTNLHETDFDPDVVIAVARGGLIPARILLNYLQKKYICTFQMGHFDPEASPTERPVLIYPLPEIDLSEKKILVVDDISDEGGTMEAVVNYLRPRVAEVRTAILVSKADSRFQADYCGKVLGQWRWVFLPWSLHEDLLSFTERVLQITGGVTIEEIIHILQDAMQVEFATRDIEKVLYEMMEAGEIRENNKIYALV